MTTGATAAACGAMQGGISGGTGFGAEALAALALGDGLVQNLLGTAACLLVLCTFSMASMRRLRMVAIASNLTFIGYAWSLGLWPILLLHSILLPLNLARLVQMERARRPRPVRPAWEGRLAGPGCGTDRRRRRRHPRGAASRSVAG